MDLRKLRGIKGCKKCPGHLESLAKALEETAATRYRFGEKDWERVYERAVGVRMALGLLKHGVDKDGNVMANLPCPPNINLEDWKNGPRFIRGIAFGDRSEDVLEKPEDLPTVPAPAPKGRKYTPINEWKKKQEEGGT